MATEQEPPPVPDNRLHMGAEWAELWRAGHREMQPYERYPSVHLIDRIATYQQRSWLREHFAAIALATHSMEGQVQDDERVRFRFMVWSPVIMGLVSVRVILDRDGNQILNAFPTRRVSGRRGGPR